MTWGEVPSVDDVETGAQERGPKRKKPRDFSEVTKKYWQDLGFDIDKVEYKIVYTERKGGKTIRKVRKHDLFGMADFAAVHSEFVGFWLIQVTTPSGASSRLKKVLSRGTLTKCLNANNHVLIQTFDNEPGTKTKLVTKLQFVELDEFDPNVLELPGLRLVTREWDPQLRNFRKVAERRLAEKTKMRLEYEEGKPRLCLGKNE